MSRNLSPAEAEARLEDARWMAETGECLSGAARRLGLTAMALDRWLYLNDQSTLAKLKARQPRDHNATVERGAAAWSPRSVASREQKRRSRARRRAEQEEGAAA